MQVLWGEAELFGKKYVLVENYMKYLLEIWDYEEKSVNMIFYDKNER